MKNLLYEIKKFLLKIEIERRIKNQRNILKYNFALDELNESISSRNSR